MYCKCEGVTVFFLHKTYSSTGQFVQNNTVKGMIITQLHKYRTDMRTVSILSSKSQQEREKHLLLKMSNFSVKGPSYQFLIFSIIMTRCFEPKSFKEQSPGVQVFQRTYGKHYSHTLMYCIILTVHFGYKCCALFCESQGMCDTDTTNSSVACIEGINGTLDITFTNLFIPMAGENLCC